MHRKGGLNSLPKCRKNGASLIVTFLEEMSQSPYTGKGKPEALKHEYSGFWSRRINSKDRIVYQVDEQAAILYILSLRKHYS